MEHVKAALRWLGSLTNREREKWVSTSKPKQMRFIRMAIGAIAAVVLSPLLVHYARKYGHSVWGNLHLFSYLVNFIPTILSILFAFVIDKDLGNL